MSCPSPAPLLPNAKVNVIYDPSDSSMKACVGSTWITLSGGGGGGGTLNDLTDVVISSPTANQALVYNGATWTNTTLTVTESDPQVGTLTANKWCSANAGATAIDCAQDAPSGATSSGAIGYVQLSDGSGGFSYSGTTAGQELFWDNTNKRLGIGTTTPQQLLHLGSAAAADRMIRFSNSLNATGLDIGVSSGSAGGYIWQRDNAILSFGTNNAEKMRIDSAGNVGIGTTNPGSALDVKGTIRLSGATSGYVGLAPATAAGSTTYTLPSTDGSNGQLLSTNGSGTLSWVSPTSTTQMLADAARPICYSALTGNADHSIVMVPLPSGATDLDSVCHTTINGSWHAGGIAKPNFVTQDCSSTPLNNTAFGGGYTSYITEATYEGSVATYANCGPTNAMICCSTSFPN